MFFADISHKFSWHLQYHFFSNLLVIFFAAKPVATKVSELYQSYNQNTIV